MTKASDTDVTIGSFDTHRSVTWKVEEEGKEKNSRLNLVVYRIGCEAGQRESDNPTISCHSNQIADRSEWTSELSLQLAASYLPCSYLASFPLASLAPPLLSELAPKTR